MSPRGRVVTPDRRCIAPDCQSSRAGTGAYCARHIGIAQRAAQGLIGRRCTAHPTEDELTCRACEAIAEDRIQRVVEDDLDPFDGMEN